MIMGIELVILCGLQASGKSSFRRDRLSGHTVVSKDLLRNNRRPERRQRQLIAEALAAGRSVVVDNTNPTAEERAPLIAIGRDLGARIIGFSFDVPFDECVARNALRPAKELVPEVGLIDVARRLQVPTWTEGFDELWRVTATGGTFEIGSIELAG